MKRVLLALLITTLGIHSDDAQTPCRTAPAKPQLGPNQWTVDSSHSAANFSVRHQHGHHRPRQLGPIAGGRGPTARTCGR